VIKRESQTKVKAGRIIGGISKDYQIPFFQAKTCKNGEGDFQEWVKTAHHSSEEEQYA
jgi:hypothetical protein